MGLMKVYERYELAAGGGGASGKNTHFFSPVVLSGCFHVHFPSYSSLISLYEAFVMFSLFFTAYFMNIMKVYEEGVFMRFFQEPFPDWAVLVKFLKGATSCNFIKKRGSYAKELGQD